MNTILGAGDPDATPEGAQIVMERDVPEIFRRCGELIAERREHPTDDLTSVLVHAEIDGEKLEDHEIVMGFFLLMAAGNDSTKATYCSGMRALMEIPRAAADGPRRPVARPRGRRGVAADVPRVRALRAHRDARHRAARAGRSARARRWSCGTRRPTATRRATRIPTGSTSRATPSTRRSARAAGTSASGPRSRGSSCKVLIEETLARFPDDGDRGHAAVRGVAVRQPAEDAAGAAGALSAFYASSRGSRSSATTRSTAAVVSG